MTKYTELTETFTTLFGEKHTNHYFSPGRINLIGEHTDYNGGHVFPAAITIGTYGVASSTDDETVRVFSKNMPDAGVIEFSMNELVFKKEDNWANYVKGMLLKLREAGHELTHGFDLVIEGTIPNGSGLSSSASLELLVGVIAEDLYGLTIDRLDLVKAGKLTENEFIGVNSGIMDQFAIGFGQKGKAILLDTNTLNYEMVPCDLGEYAVVIMNTNKRRELADSKYNERRSECEEALKQLQTVVSIASLGDLTQEVFEENCSVLTEDVYVKRARHAVTENLRTLQAKEALTQGNLIEFGKLLNASHQSLKEDYEVTGIELDTLVEAAQKQENVLGARMTGAGFGGCSIALVKESAIPAFQRNVETRYKEVVGYNPSFYIAHIGNGSMKVKEE